MMLYDTKALVYHSSRSSQKRLISNRSSPFHTLPASLLLATAALKLPIIPGGPLPYTRVHPRATPSTNPATTPYRSGRPTALSPSGLDPDADDDRLLVSTCTSFSPSVDIGALSVILSIINTFTTTPYLAFNFLIFFISNVTYSISLALLTAYTSSTFLPIVVLGARCTTVSNTGKMYIILILPII
jgi:hypothetical protein